MVTFFQASHDQIREIKKYLPPPILSSYALGGRTAVAFCLGIKQANLQNLSDVDLYKIQYSDNLPHYTLNQSSIKIKNYTLPIQVINSIPAGGYLIDLADKSPLLNLLSTHGHNIVQQTMKSYTSFTPQSILESYDINATGVIYFGDYIYINSDFNQFLSHRVIGLTEKQINWFGVWFELEKKVSSLPLVAISKDKIFEDFTKLTIYLKISLLRLYKYVNKPINEYNGFSKETHQIILQYLNIIINKRYLEIANHEIKTNSLLKYGYNTYIAPEIINFFDDNLEKKLRIF